jgi:hypothetical protein
MSNQNEEEKEAFNFDYFKISDAVNDIKSSSGAKNKTVSTIKLLGKGLFNSAKFIAEEAPKFLQASAYQNMKDAEKKLKNKNLSNEQKDLYTKMRDSHKKTYEYFKERNEDK